MDALSSIDDLIQSATNDWNSFFAGSVIAVDADLFSKELVKIGRKVTTGDYAGSLTAMERQYAAFESIGDTYSRVRGSALFVNYKKKLQELYAALAKNTLQVIFTGKAHVVADGEEIGHRDRLLVINPSTTSVIMLDETWDIGPQDFEARNLREEYGKLAWSHKKVRLSNDGGIEIREVQQSKKFQFYASHFKAGLVYKMES